MVVVVVVQVKVTVKAKGSWDSEAEGKVMKGEVKVTERRDRMVVQGVQVKVTSEKGISDDE